MKKILCLLAFLSLALCAGAQNTGTFRSRLATPDGRGGAMITVNETPAAAQAVSSMSTNRLDRKIGGYRVRIYFDNSQNARSNAGATQARFRELYPDTPSYMVYENPYFKVTVGNYMTMEEAVIMWGRIKTIFETAFVVREDIPLRVFAD